MFNNSTPFVARLYFQNRLLNANPSSNLPAIVLFVISLILLTIAGPHRSNAAEVPVFGGELRYVQRSEPRTFNPLFGLDVSSRQVLFLLNADLIHISRLTLEPEPALAESWAISPDKRTFTIRLRNSLRFSDGVPLTVDDIEFTFRVILDERVHAPQRDLLSPRGQPPQVNPLDARTLRFVFAEPYAAAARLFDGIPVLPRHLLEQSYRAGALDKAWTVSSPPHDVVGTGPFRLQSVQQGERIVLERNPFYWKLDNAGRHLPYLDRVVAIATSNASAQAMQLVSGQADMADALTAGNFKMLEQWKERRGLSLIDGGPSLNASFLFFNLNASAGSRPMAAVFQDEVFRRAAALVIDRSTLARIAGEGRADALTTFVTAADPYWRNREMTLNPPSPAQARAMLQQARYSWHDGALQTPSGKKVAFTLVYSASNPQYGALASLISKDFESIGVEVRPVPLEFHSLLDRVFHSFDFEAAIMALAAGDTDPNFWVNTLSSGGSTHLWDIENATRPTPAWQSEIDTLVAQQMTQPDRELRKSLFDRVQRQVGLHAPLIPLISIHLLAAANQRLVGFRPALLPEGALWNADQLFFRPPAH